MRWQVLEGVPEGDVRQLLSIARRRVFRRGEVVFHVDDPADTLHLIVSGRFAVRVQTPVGDVAILAVLGPGDMFGELALIGGESRRTATVEALQAGETRSIHRPDFERLRAQHPSVTDVLVAILSEGMRRLSRHLLEALYVPADKRVLRRLGELAESYAPGAAEAVIPLRQEDLASIAGTSRATVNRVLREEESRGSVRLERGRTIVLDRAALERRGR
ncbi:MAG: Crp/Fnr family transcriptional regulator [Thermoleophilia bacterium]|nr:Crp/Fnr family transcriptional regulator [Thermoleophilia bacterium]